MLGRNHNTGSDPDYFGMTQSAMSGALSAVNQIAQLGGLGQSQRIKDENQAHQQEEWGRQNQFRKDFSDAWQSGDNAALDRVMGMFPEFIPQMQQALGLKDDQHNQKVASLMMKLNGLVNSGDTAGIRQLLQSNQSLLNPGDMEHWNGALAALDGKDEKAKAQARQQLDQYTKGIIRASFKNPMQMMDSILKESQQTETERRDREAHEDRQAGNQLGWANYNERKHYHGQLLDLKQQGILNAGGGDLMTDSQGNPLSSFDYNRQLLQTGTDPRTGKRATGAQLSNAQKWMKGNQDFTSAQTTLINQLGKINELLSGDTLESGTGRIAGRMPDFTTGEKGLQVRNLLDSIKSGEFTTNVKQLKGMGALSNSEGAKLMDLTAKIDPTQPTSVIRKQLGAVKDQYQRLIQANQQDAADMGYGHTVLQAYTGGKNPNDVGDMSDAELLDGL